MFGGSTSEVIPCGLWVVWSVGGPWKPPLAITQSCPSSLGTLIQLHCPDSKSQLPGGLQAPSLTETSSSFGTGSVSDCRTALNPTWWGTWTVLGGISQEWQIHTECSLFMVWLSESKKVKTAYTVFPRGGHGDLCHLPACRGLSRPLPKGITQLPAQQHMHSQAVGGTSG